MENTNKLTQKEIFDQICKLQEDMTGNANALARLSGAIATIFEEEEHKGNYAEAIEGICGVFAYREENYRLMLGSYQKMYEDANPNSIAEGKIQVLTQLANVVTNHSAFKSIRDEVLPQIKDCITSLLN